MCWTLDVSNFTCITMGEELSVARLEGGIEFRVIRKSFVHASRRDMSKKSVQAVNSFTFELLRNGQVGMGVAARRRGNRSRENMEEPVYLSPGDLYCGFGNWKR